MKRERDGVTYDRGKWRARIWVNGESLSLGRHDTPEDAARAVEAARQQVKERGAELPRELTLNELAGLWFTARERRNVRGVRQERSRWRRHIQPSTLGAMPVKRITRPMIVRWVRSLRHVEAADVVPKRGGGTDYRKTGRTLSRQTQVHLLKLVLHALESAVDEGRIKVNPARGVRVERDQGRTEETWAWLTTDEIRLVTTSTKLSEMARTVFTVAIFTGLRKGELIGLRWPDVRLDGARPHLVVRHSHDGPTKSGLVREVPLLPPAVAALRRWREMLDARRRKRKVVLFEPRDAHVWTARGGGLHHRDWDAGWRRYAQPLLSRSVRFHDLRHTCASHLIMGTWGVALSLPEVRDWLGHSSISVTQRYAHLAPEGLADKAARMAREWHEPH